MVLIGVLIDQNYKSASLSRPHLRPAMENVSIYKSIVVMGGAPVPRSRPGSKQYLITGNDCLNLVPARPANTPNRVKHFIGGWTLDRGGLLLTASLSGVLRS